MTIADIEGPGYITHIWMTQSCPRILADRYGARAPHDPDYYRKVLLRMTWDDRAHPSVLVPLGDFFCPGHSIANNLASLPFTASVRPENVYRFGGIELLLPDAVPATGAHRARERERRAVPAAPRITRCRVSHRHRITRLI